MENNRKKILITGVCGLIGRKICKKLSDEYDIDGVDNLFRNDINEVQQYCNFHPSNLIDFLSSNNNTYEYIFHLSAINGTRYFYEIPNKVIENNLSSDLAIFEYAKSNISTKVIYASSSEIVADSNSYPVSEETDIVLKNIHNPRWSYRLSKIISENYLMNSDLNFLIVRFFNVYGQHSVNGHFVADILEKIHNKNFDLYGHDETRSFCYIDNAVDAVLSIYKNISKEVVNIGNDQELSIEEAANIITKNMNLDNVVWTRYPGRNGSTKRRIPDISKLKKYYPTYNPISFDEGIKRVLNGQRS